MLSQRTLGEPRRGKRKRLAVLKGPRRSTIKVWEGPSAFDGEPIYLAITNLIRESENPKTGPMLQSWIMPVNMTPHEASQSGNDKSVCGNCVRRPSNLDTLRKEGMKKCYLQTWRAPGSIHRTIDPRPVGIAAAQRAIHQSGRPLRWGAWGDPAMLPIELGRELSSAASDHVGYTSQWQYDFAQPWKPLLMASATSTQEMLQAQAMGWQTFRSDKIGSRMADHEKVCPAYDTHNTVQCIKCLLCNPKNERDIITAQQ